MDIFLAGSLIIDHSHLSDGGPLGLGPGTGGADEGPLPTGCDTIF